MKTPVDRQDEAVCYDQLRAGDELVWETVVRRHAAALFACARRSLRCEADAADAVQEALVAAFRFRDSFQGASQLGTWLHRILVNCCLMKLRRKKPRRTVSIDPLLPAFDGAGRHVRRVAPWAEQPEDPLHRAEVNAQVRACIDALPRDYRTIILLRDIEGFDTPTTAALLGISRGVVKTRLHRAHQALRSLLEPLFAEIGAPRDGRPVPPRPWGPLR